MSGHPDSLSRRKAYHLVLPVLLVTCGLLLATASGCGGDNQTTDDDPAWVQTVIYFGLNIPGGDVVTVEQFEDFLRDVATVEFPMGLTVFDSRGQMMRADETIEKQETKVVLLVHEDTTENSDAANRVITTYQSQFGTPQVMLTRQVVDVDLFQGATKATAPTRDEVEEPH